MPKKTMEPTNSSTFMNTIRNIRGDVTREHKLLFLSFFMFFSASLICHMISCYTSHSEKTYEETDIINDKILQFIEPKPVYRKLSGFTMILSVLSFIVFVSIHDNRAIILKRFFVLATCICILQLLTFVTLLPSPQRDDERKSRVNGLISAVMTIFETILYPAYCSMESQTCANCLFSGEIAFLTLFWLFFCEYLPKKNLFIISVLFAVVAFGAIFVLMAHDNYFADVIFAIFLTKYTFTSYHLVVFHVNNFENYIPEDLTPKQIQEYRKKIMRKSYINFYFLFYVFEKNTPNIQNTIRIPKVPLMNRSQKRGCQIENPNTQSLEV